MKVVAVNRDENRWFDKLFRIISDPYYYALSLPSFFLLFLASVLFLGILGLVMAVLWFAIRSIAHGERPDFGQVHPKMFVGGACVAMMPLVSGVLSRRLTRPEIRGKFVHFSKKINYKNGHFSFTVIDMRNTQLIGTNIVVEIITGFGAENLVCRRVDLGPPGIIAIPTEIRIPVGSVFPSLNEIVSCDFCGKSNFSSFKTYSCHMAWLHGITKREATEDVMRSLEAELANLRLLRVVLTGADEVSGKGGIATKEYRRHDVNIGGFSGTDAFSVKTIISDEPTDSSNDDEISTTLSAKSSYIHVDFRPT